MEVGVPLQVAVTPGLVQFSALPPAGPEAANVPVHGAPASVVPLNEKVPEKSDAVAVPLTMPENV
jgi:hypothetical protein